MRPFCRGNDTHGQRGSHGGSQPGPRHADGGGRLRAPHVHVRRPPQAHGLLSKPCAWRVPQAVKAFDRRRGVQSEGPAPAEAPLPACAATALSTRPVRPVCEPFVAASQTTAAGTWALAFFMRCRGETFIAPHAAALFRACCQRTNIAVLHGPGLSFYFVAAVRLRVARRTGTCAASLHV
jgi:hypothetical protein